MVVTDDGMLTVLRAVQPSKALSGILVVPSGMIACPFSSGVTIQRRRVGNAEGSGVGSGVRHDVLLATSE